MKPLKQAISPTGKFSSYFPYFHQLEDIVVALTFETLHRNNTEIIAYLGLVVSAIKQYKQMFDMVQLYLEDQGISDYDLGNSGFVKEKRKKPSKKESWDSMNMMEHKNHDVFLNETTQLLRTSVEDMPNKFLINVDYLRHSLLHWMKLAEKDFRLRDIMKPHISEILANIDDGNRIKDQISLSSAIEDKANAEAMLVC